MLSLTILPNGDGAWPDLQDQVDKGTLLEPVGNIEIAFLDFGMASGRPSVAIRFNLPDGRTVLAQTSARLFASAGRALLAKYPGLFDDAPPPAI
jgi:hypothetical protein